MGERWRFTFRYTSRFGHPEYSYEVVGALGGLHLHITDHGELHAQNYGNRCSGGLEAHHRQPPLYMAERPPSHDWCWLLKCPCWHDGTSLYVSESIIPRWDGRAFDMEFMERLICREADERFYGGGDDE